MKRALAIFLTALTLVAFTSCKSKKDTNIPDGYKISSTADEHFTLAYPEKWIADRSDGMVSVYFSDSDVSSVSVTTFAVPSDVVDYKEYFKSEYFDNLKNTLADLESVTEGEETKFAGKNALKYEYTATVGGTPYKFMQVMVYNKGYIYTLTYTSTASLYDTHLEDVYGMITNSYFG